MAQKDDTHLNIKKEWLTFLWLFIFNMSCAAQTSVYSCQPNCQGDVKYVEHDATSVPIASFVYVQSTNVYKNECLGQQACLPTLSSASGSGFIIHRSVSDPTTAYVMTADHICKHMNATDEKSEKLAHKFIVADYHGNIHRAKLFFSNDSDDVCVLQITGLRRDIPIAQVADVQPAVGSRVYNVSAPRSYFNPDAALIFDGIYSGDVKGDGLLNGSLYTVPTMPGSSGSPVFNSSGRVIGMVVAVPLKDEPEENESGTKLVILHRVVESLALAKSLAVIKETYAAVITLDTVLSISKTSTITSH